MMPKNSSTGPGMAKAEWAALAQSKCSFCGSGCGAGRWCEGRGGVTLQRSRFLIPCPKDIPGGNQSALKG